MALPARCHPCWIRQAPLVVVTFYRSYLVAADLGPIEALFALRFGRAVFACWGCSRHR